MTNIESIVERCSAYGQVLRAWEGARGVGRAGGDALAIGPLAMNDASRFALGLHLLLRTARPVQVYRFLRRGAPESELTAPVADEMLRGWWSPERPTTLLAGLQTGARSGSERMHLLPASWEGFDLCVEATLLPGSLVYAGHTATHAEGRAFDTDSGPAILPAGGGLQFLLVEGHSTLGSPRSYRLD